MQSKLVFQSTHPRGVRRSGSSASIGSAPVSIHAPTRGATRVGQDYERFTKVSIHAPTRGATVCFYYPAPSVKFQSTHPRGVRHAGASRNEWGKWFQSTHPRGVRLKRHGLTILFSSFNPRTHEGCDFADSHYFLSVYVSIHAPTRGATPISTKLYNKTLVSIHAPTRGAT